MGPWFRVVVMVSLFHVRRRRPAVTAQLATTTSNQIMNGLVNLSFIVLPPLTSIYSMYMFANAGILAKIKKGISIYRKSE
jgi:hypothetical protein